MNNTKLISICIYKKFPHQISQKLFINCVKHHDVTLPCKNTKILPRIYILLKNPSLHRI